MLYLEKEQELRRDLECYQLLERKQPQEMNS